jgi:hypothetical protein
VGILFGVSELQIAIRLRSGQALHYGRDDKVEGGASIRHWLFGSREYSSFQLRGQLFRGFGGRSCGIPHLAKHKRDVGHPMILGPDKRALLGFGDQAQVG